MVSSRVAAEGYNKTEKTLKTRSPTPAGYEPYLVSVENVALGHPWPLDSWIRKTPEDWQALMPEMTRVQRLVHLAGRWTPDDVEDFADRQFAQAKATYQETITNELSTWGCAGQGILGEGPELTALRERVDWSSNSVANTYNYELAREIIRIREDTPTANRHVYARRLYYGQESWDSKYWVDKREQVGQIETMTMINAAKSDFYNRNPQLYEKQLEAWVVPLDTVCAVCEEYVSGNPYPSVEALYMRCLLPAHLGCPHFSEVRVGQKLRPRECAELWNGV